MGVRVTWIHRKLWIPMRGAWDGFHVLFIPKLKQFYNLKKRYKMTNCWKQYFLNKIDWFNFLIKNLPDEGKHFIIRRFFKASVSRLAEKQFSSSTRRRANFSSSVCDFQSMKTPVELNSLLSKFFCYITWLDATMDDLQTRPLRQTLLFLWNNSLTV